MKNWVGESGDVTPTKSLSQNIRRSEFFCDFFFFFFFFFFFWGGGGSGRGGGGHRVDVNKELKFLWKFKKNGTGGSGREG